MSEPVDLERIEEEREMYGSRSGLADVPVMIAEIRKLRGDVKWLEDERRRLIFRPSVFDAAISDRWPAHE